MPGHVAAAGCIGATVKITTTSDSRMWIFGARTCPVIPLLHPNRETNAVNLVDDFLRLWSGLRNQTAAASPGALVFTGELASVRTSPSDLAADGVAEVVQADIRVARDANTKTEESRSRIITAMRRNGASAGSEANHGPTD
ncbi:hypothetical protein Aca07nite_84990 [Actinoplanes capillaceus]|uniref:Uncharacterized protein n=1 Tax=Actinoplanes campanulatus TaxID=113559 RepID=A0ABQ3WYE3_9ACTN|nr:hypothetical protein Aca07nite_84990 [Actinoplanes capillaceus]